MSTNDAAQFVAIHNEQIRRAARSLLIRQSCSDPGSHADDVTQEVSIKLWRFWSTLKSPESAVRTIVVNTVRSHARTCRRKAHENLEQSPVVSVDPGAAYEASMYLNRVLPNLEEIDQQILIRHYFHGDSFEEISARLGVPSATIRSRHFRAMTKLNKL